MNQRNFSGAPAVGFALACAFAYTIFDYFFIHWMAYIVWVLFGAAFYYALVWIIESAAIIIGTIHETRMEMWKNEIISSSRDLILAEHLRGMPSDALRVFELLATATYDPNDPANDILPGFALLTRKFAIAYFASCGHETLTPIRAYSEGTRDRQRDQASELLDWLVTQGFVSHWGGNQRAAWIAPDSARLARELLGLIPPSPSEI